jgi:hypothetical protein
MKKIYLDYNDWYDILFGKTGLPNMQEQLLNFIRELAIRDDVRVILTHSGEQELVLKYDADIGKFSEQAIDK